MSFVQLCLLIVAFIFIALTRGSRESNFVGQASVRGMRKLDSWRNGDWAKWRVRRDSDDLKRRMGKAPLKIRTGHRPSPSVEDPFVTEAGPSSPKRPSISPVTGAHRLPRFTRQRVVSSPTLPSKLRHHSPRRMAPHMHEVKKEPSRRRYEVDMAADSDGGEGTPRVQRTFSQAHEVSFPSRQRRISAKGKERASEERETSPGSTVAGGESSEESGVWEDTSSEGGDEGESAVVDDLPEEAELGPAGVIAVSEPPFKVSWEAHPSQETLRIV